MSSKTQSSFNINAFTSAPIVQQDLKRCRLRSVPYCTSAVFFFMAIVYVWLFCYYGIEMMYTNSVLVRYDEKCKNQTACIVEFDIEKKMKGPVGIYYRLTNFKQMHREIATSFQRDMLQGKVVSKDQLDDCKPRLYINDVVNVDNLFIPCGLLPYAVFNDTLNLIEDNTFSEKGITLEVDKNELYKAPNEAYNNSVNWLKDTGLFEGQQDEHFIVWMRQSAFSPFRKLYSKTSDDLEPGKYHMSIRNNYPVDFFKGEKWFVIAEIGSFGTNQKGPAIVFGLLFAFFLIASGILGIIGWRRMKPTSQFHPNNLKKLFINTGEGNN